MKLKFSDYTKRQDILNKLSEDIVISHVSARDKTTGLFTSANLVHSVTFAKTFILIRLNEGSNLVLNILDNGVEWNEKDIQLNFGEVILSSELLAIFKKVVLGYLYVD